MPLFISLSLYSLFLYHSQPRFQSDNAELTSANDGLEKSLSAARDSLASEEKRLKEARDANTELRNKHTSLQGAWQKKQSALEHEVQQLTVWPLDHFPFVILLFPVTFLQRQVADLNQELSGREASEKQKLTELQGKIDKVCFLMSIRFMQPFYFNRSLKLNLIGCGILEVINGLLLYFTSGSFHPFHRHPYQSLLYNNAFMRF